MDSSGPHAPHRANSLIKQTMGLSGLKRKARFALRRQMVQKGRDSLHGKASRMRRAMPIGSRRNLAARRRKARFGSLSALARKDRSSRTELSNDGPSATLTNYP